MHTILANFLRAIAAAEGEVAAVSGTALVSEIISILVAGISGIATGIGSGLSTLVMNIFLTSAGTLSAFGVVIVVFGGISLAVGLSRWVVNWVTSLGAMH